MNYDEVVDAAEIWLAGAADDFDDREWERASAGAAIGNGWANLAFAKLIKEELEKDEQNLGH